MYCEVRYENLIANPNEEIRRVVDFCELDWHGEFEENIPGQQTWTRNGWRKPTTIKKETLKNQLKSSGKCRNNLSQIFYVPLLPRLVSPQPLYRPWQPKRNRYEHEEKVDSVKGKDDCGQYGCRRSNDYQNG